MDAEYGTGFIGMRAEANQSIEPDMALISIWFSHKFPTKEECVSHFAKQKAAVLQALEPFGLADDLKTSYFDCWAYRTHRTAQPRDYEYSCRGTLRLRRDGYDVSAIASALVESRAQAGIDVSFYLDDPDAVRTDLMARAVRRARSQAEAVASAAGVSLGLLKRVSNSEDEGFEFMRADGAALTAPGAAPQSAELELDPEPVKVSADVIAEWWVEQ